MEGVDNARLDRDVFTFPERALNPKDQQSYQDLLLEMDGRSETRPKQQQPDPSQPNVRPGKFDERDSSRWQMRTPSTDA